MIDSIWITIIVGLVVGAILLTLEYKTGFFANNTGKNKKDNKDNATNINVSANINGDENDQTINING